jgi:hypothetical protein
MVLILQIYIFCLNDILLPQNIPRDLRSGFNSSLISLKKTELKLVCRLSELKVLNRVPCYRLGSQMCILVLHSISLFLRESKPSGFLEVVIFNLTNTMVMKMFMWEQTELHLGLIFL